MSSTIKDISHRTGLGLATISKYLNGGNVLDQNKEAIEKAIKELDFHVNEFARGLKTNRSKTIGVVIPELSSIFCTSIITIIEDILRKSGYAIMVCDCRTDEKLEVQAVEFLINKMVDGIINMPVSKDGEHLKLPLSKNIPVVLIDRYMKDLAVDAVLIDNVKASQEAVDYLIDNGHQKIGIICGSQGIFTTQQRLLGYNQAFILKGMSPENSLIDYGEYTVEGGYESMKRLLKKNISAVLVTNYEMTLGAIIAINEMGIKIPDELSFIGFDNLQISQIIMPKLAIVLQPIEKIAENAAQIMLQRLSGQRREATVVTLSPQLVPGDSVKKLNL